jgi:hypothetical protein
MTEEKCTEPLFHKGQEVTVKSLDRSVQGNTVVRIGQKGIVRSLCLSSEYKNKYVVTFDTPIGMGVKHLPNGGRELYNIYKWSFKEDDLE